MQILLRRLFFNNQYLIKMKKHLLIIALSVSSLIVAQTPLIISDSIHSGGVYRKYLLYIPTLYNSSQSVPLVFDIHGYNCKNDQQMKYGDFRPIAIQQILLLRFLRH